MYEEEDKAKQNAKKKIVVVKQIATFNDSTRTYLITWLFLLTFCQGPMVTMQDWRGAPCQSGISIPNTGKVKYKVLRE